MLGVIAALLAAGVVIVTRRLDPYVRDQTLKYLRERFDANVEVGAIQVRVLPIAPLRLLLSAGRDGLVSVEGENIRIRHEGRQDIPPLFVLRKFRADVDLESLFGDPKRVKRVVLEGMEITIPPKGQRKGITGRDQNRDAPNKKKSRVILEEVIVRQAKLAILPRDPKKVPLRFDLQDIRLESAGKDVAMRYQAVLTNPKPPGNIRSSGTFGPWASGEPGDTPLGGTYLFENADLGVFKGIAGILRSTGKFQGTLSAVSVQGEASVPEFRLKRAQNAVPLKTQFDVMVDGTNGNTELKPVVALLGSTHFTTKGFVVKHEGDRKRTIYLEALMPAGNLRDVLRLAMKGSPIMDGTLRLDTKIGVPPLSGKVKEKLVLDGNFDITNGRFLRAKIQEKIDGLARRGQGQPKNQGIDDVFHRMSGDFDMADEKIQFHPLAFEVQGATVNVNGEFDLDSDALDFHGVLMLDAKVSETMSGWKRWLLKPIDPFFSKRGAGTFLPIKVEGTSKDPRFGLDRGGKSRDDKAQNTSERSQKIVP